MTYIVREVLENIAFVYKERLDPDGRFIEHTWLNEVFEVYYKKDYRLRGPDGAILSDEIQRFSNEMVLIPLRWGSSGQLVQKRDMCSYEGISQLENGLIVTDELARESGFGFHPFQPKENMWNASLARMANKLIELKAVGEVEPYEEKAGLICEMSRYRKPRWLRDQ